MSEDRKAILCSVVYVLGNAQLATASMLITCMAESDLDDREFAWSLGSRVYANSIQRGDITTDFQIAYISLREVHAEEIAEVAAAARPRKGVAHGT